MVRGRDRVMCRLSSPVAAQGSNRTWRRGLICLRCSPELHDMLPDHNGRAEECDHGRVSQPRLPETPRSRSQVAGRRSQRPEDRIGSWPSRDPIQERGGINLYVLVRNNAIGRYDKYGLVDSPETLDPGQQPPPSDTSIRKCNRKIENDDNDFVIGAANVRGGNWGHI